MALIKDLIQRKPSVALEHMLKGLMNPKGVTIDMRTFGHVRSHNNFHECYGCAATVSIQSILNVRYDKVISDYLKSEHAPDDFTGCVEVDVHWSDLAKSGMLDEYTLDANDVLDFELAIDFARQGNLNLLFSYCGIEYDFDTISRYVKFDTLCSRHYQDNFEDLQFLIGKLKEKGF